MSDTGKPRMSPSALAWPVATSAFVSRRGRVHPVAPAIPRHEILTPEQQAAASERRVHAAKGKRIARRCRNLGHPSVAGYGFCMCGRVKA